MLQNVALVDSQVGVLPKQFSCKVLRNFVKFVCEFKRLFEDVGVKFIGNSEHLLTSTIGKPAIISYSSIPNCHQSHLSSYPIPSITSGDMYSGVPQAVKVFSPPNNILASPRSTNFT